MEVMATDILMEVVQAGPCTASIDDDMTAPGGWNGLAGLVSSVVGAHQGALVCARDWQWRSVGRWWGSQWCSVGFNVLAPRPGLVAK